MANRKHPVKEEQILVLAKLLTELEQEDMYNELGLTNAQIAKILAKRSGYTNVSADAVGRIRNKDYVCLRPAPEPEPEPEPEVIDATEAITEAQWQNLVMRALNATLDVQESLLDTQKSVLSSQHNVIESDNIICDAVNKMVTVMKNLLVKIDALDGKMDQVSFLVTKFYNDCGGKIE